MGIIKFLNSRKLNKIFNYVKNGEKRNIQIKEKIVKKRKFIKEEGLMDKDIIYIWQSSALRYSKKMKMLKMTFFELLIWRKNNN